MFDPVLIGWSFVALSILLVGAAVRLDRRLQQELPPILRTTTPSRPKSSWMDELDDDVFGLVEAFPSRWRRELYCESHQAAIDEFWRVVLLAVAAAAVGGTLLSVSGAAI